MSGRSRNRNKQNNKKQTNQKKSQAKKKKKQVDPKVLWGDVDALPSPDGFAISTPDPVAVVNSLGQPPLPGHGAASPHYFKLVYSRATQLAGALAMAGQIDDLTPEPLPEPEEDEAISDDPNTAVDPKADDEAEADGNTLTEDDPLTEAEDSLSEANSDEEE